MIYAVVFLEHEETLVTFEGMLDLLDLGSHPGLDITLFSLKFIRTLVKRKDQEVNSQT